MRTLAVTAALTIAGLGISACDNRDEAAEGTAAPSTEAIPADEGATADATAEAPLVPQGSRVIVENGTPFRVDPDGTRVRLEDPRIIVEDDTVFQVTPEGTRVRIGPDGAEVEVREDKINARVRTDEPSIKVDTKDR